MILSLWHDKMLLAYKLYEVSINCRRNIFQRETRHSFKYHRGWNIRDTCVDFKMVTHCMFKVIEVSFSIKQKTCNEKKK